MTLYIAAYDAESAECLAACRRIVQAHRRHELPATFFITGKVLEADPDEYRRLLDDPLFEVASHTYSHKMLMQSIDKTLAMGGNYLLNVGPKADGTLPRDARASLCRVGQWYVSVREALEDAEPAPDLLDRDEFMLTRRGNALYVHFHKDPEATGVLLGPLKTAPRNAVLLNTGEPIRAGVEVMPTLSVPPNRRGACLRLSKLPANELTGEVMVVKLEFDDLDEALRTAAEEENVDECRL